MKQTRATAANLGARRAKQPSAVRPVLRDRVAGYAAFLAIALTLFIYYAIGTGGSFNSLAVRSSTGFTLLADAFLLGQTQLPIEPSPELLNLPDPYDPMQNYRLLPIRDLSLYKGHFYWYMGPAPALLLTPVKVLVSGPSTLFSDNWLTFSFVSGLLGSCAWLVVRCRKQFFPDVPPWMVGPAIVAGSLALPITWLVAHPHLLEAPVSGGQCFLVLGLCIALSQFISKRGMSRPKLFAAGSMWAMAWGCRLSLAPAIFVIALLTTIEVRRASNARRLHGSFIWESVAIWLPLALAGAGLAIYNHVRFESWTETGWNYQLAWMNHHALAGKGVILSIKHVPRNLYRYFLELPRWKNTFPYVVPQSGIHGMSRIFPPPPEFTIALEPTAGLIWSAPVCMLAAGLIFPLRRRIDSTTDALNMPFFRWLARCLVAGFTLGIGPVLCGVGSIERYAADGTVSLLLLSIFGAWRLYCLFATQVRVRRLVLFSFAVAIVITINFGFLLLLEV